MPRVPNFYSINEILKPSQNRRYHNNGTCSPGRDILQKDRRRGQSGYQPCEDCERLNQRGR